MATYQIEDYFSLREFLSTITEYTDRFRVSTTEIAQATGLDRGTVSSLLNGAYRESPSFKTVCLLALYADVPLDRFLHRDQWVRIVPQTSLTLVQGSKA